MRALRATSLALLWVVGCTPQKTCKTDADCVGSGHAYCKTDIGACFELTDGGVENGTGSSGGSTGTPSAHRVTLDNVPSHQQMESQGYRLQGVARPDDTLQSNNFKLRLCGPVGCRRQTP